MFLISLSRIIKFSFVNFGRNIWLSAVTITIIVLTLFSVTSLIFVNATLTEAIGIVKAKVDVSVYFKPSVNPEQVQAVRENLRALPYVREVIYVPKAEALEKLRNQYNNSPLIIEALKELESNPLGDTLIIGTHDTADYQKVIDVLNTTPAYASLIENKNFDDNRFVIEKLQTLATQAEQGGWGIAIFFGIVSVLVIVNTIRIAIYTHRSEIGIMKLVGASNAFVRGPFIGEAILYAVIGTAVTAGLAFFAAHVAEPYIVSVLGQTNFSLLSYLRENALLIFGAELLATTAVAILATMVALTRYLRV